MFGWKLYVKEFSFVKGAINLTFFVSQCYTCHRNFLKQEFANWISGLTRFVDSVAVGFGSNGVNLK